MADITYERIQPLIAESKQEGRTMNVTFVCPTTQTSVSATAGIEKGRGLADVAKRSAQKNVMSSVRRSISRTVRGVLGFGILGRVGTDMANELMSNLSSGGESFSDDEKRAATVRAFESVSSRFTWDPKSGRFVAASAADRSGFDQQLTDAPVVERYDRGVLARLLVEIAAADGKVDDSERAFLEDFVTPDLGSLDELLRRSALSRAELGETSAGAVRESIVMLAWAVAFADEELELSETRRITEAGDAFGLSGERIDALKREAQLHLYDEALAKVYAQGKVDPGAKADADAFAGRIGMSSDDVERADIRYRKRTGLV